MTKKHMGCPSCGLALGPRTISKEISVTCPRCFTLYVKQTDGIGKTPAAVVSERARTSKTARRACATLKKSLRTTEFPLTVGGGASLHEVSGDVVGGALKMFDDENPRVVIGAAFAARRLVDGVERIGPALLALLEHPHDLVRATARWSLRALGPEAVELLSDRVERGPRRAPVADALAFLGRRAERALPALRRALARCVADEANALRSAIGAIAGPWEADPEIAIPYMGESLTFEHDEKPKPIAEELVWIGIVEACAQHHLSSDTDIYSLDGWLEAGEGTGEITRWTPDRIVLGRPTVTLEAYNFHHEETDPRTTRVTVTAADRRGFTMSELMYQVRAAYATHSNDWGSRIFEGLEREEPGVYYIKTGS